MTSVIDIGGKCCERTGKIRLYKRSDQRGRTQASRWSGRRGCRRRGDRRDARRRYGLLSGASRIAGLIVIPGIGPGIGPVVAAGVLATTLAGAATGATGGILGALVDYGISKEKAPVYAESIRRGGTLVSVRAEETRAD